MISIALLHRHYSETHLQEVIEIMRKRGTPTIRCILDYSGLWFAVEGCHRIRAAKILGLTPKITDVTANAYITIQQDGEKKKIRNTDKYKQNLIDDGARLNLFVDFTPDEA